jgi:hypothetical protein
MPVGDDPELLIPVMSTCPIPLTLNNPLAVLVNVVEPRIGTGLGPLKFTTVADSARPKIPLGTIWQYL